MGSNRMKILMIVSDGMGDIPQKKLRGLTPLESAKTPNMDTLAKKGRTGLMHVLGKGVIPTSDKAHLTLFGYSVKQHFVGRGPFEALGVGMKLKPGDIAFRCNFGTVKKGIAVDRRAGRIESVKELTKELDGMKINGIKFILKPGTSHRAALVMRGKGLSEMIGNSDPHKTGARIKKVVPLNKSKQAKFTAETLNEFLEKSHLILEKHPVNEKRKKAGKKPANYLLLRGAGKMKNVPGMKKRFGLNSSCVSGAGLYKGVASFVGMKILKVKGATGKPNTNIKAKIARAVKELKKNDLVFVHVKGCDLFGHDGDCNGKKKFIEKLDLALKPLLKLERVVIAITADHSTPCSKLDHSSDPVPVLTYSSTMKGDSVEEFGEKYCKNGSLGTIQGKNFLKLLLRQAGRK